VLSFLLLKGGFELGEEELEVFLWIE